MVTRPHNVAPAVQPRQIGARVTRAEDPRLLTGQGEFIADFKLPGELHVAFVRSSMSHARIASVDTAEAALADGVHAVWTSADVRKYCPGLEGVLGVEGCVATHMPLLAHDYVRYVGEPIAAVVAETRAIAEDACDLVSADYAPLPAVMDPREAVRGGPKANSDLESNVTLRGNATYGNVDAAFAVATKVVAATYRTGRLSPCPMEGRGCVALHSWQTNELKLWASTQVPHLLKYLVTLYLGFAEHLTEVLVVDTGGGFGEKCHVFPEEMVVCLLARELGRPLKWVEDRRENLLGGIHAHEQFVEIAYALDERGRITAQRMHALGDGGAYHSVPWSMAVEPWCATAVCPTGVYRIPAFAYTYEAAATNKTPVGAYRGVGYMAGAFVHEVLADEAARALGISPFEFRRRNVVSEFPYTDPRGLTYEEGSWAQCIDELERVVDYAAFSKRQDDLRQNGRYLGLGISIYVESTGESTAMGMSHGLEGTYFDSATVKMEPGGTVTVTTGLPTQGQGNRTTVAQVAADVLGVRLDDVTVRCGESTAYTWGSGTLGSRATVVAAGAVVRAADDIRTKLKRIAAHMLEASEADIELVDGRAQVLGAPDRHVPIAAVAATIYFDVASYPEDFDPTLEVSANYDPARPIFSNGAHAFIVEVDVETGFVTVEGAFAIEDCGTVINPAIVEGQLRGGMTQGIGAALLEEIVYDEASGQLLTTTFADYMLPTVDVVPRFSFHHIETPSNHTPAGIKGMGEAGLIASPGAMLNAVNDALVPFGVTMREIPVTPERILRALGIL